MATNPAERETWQENKIMDTVEEKFIPFISDLKEVIENSKDGWHQNESVFNHTLSVLSALKNTIAENKNLYFLNEKIEKHILEKFDFTEKEKERTLRIIANHTEIHILLAQGNDLSRFEEIKKTFPDIWQELLLLGYADTKNSKLKEVNLKEFEYRINFYEKEIKLWSVKKRKIQ